MNYSERQIGIVCILAAAMLWGTTGTAQAFAPPGSDPLVIGALRLLTGGAILCAVSAWRHEFGRWRDWNWFLVAAAAFCIGSFQLCFFASVRLTGVAVGTMVAIGSGPLLGGLLGHFCFGEKLTLRWCLATLLAVAGCLLLVSGGAAMSVNVWGVALALGAGVGYGGYNFLLKALLSGPVQHPPRSVAALATGGGALLLLPVLGRLDWNWLMQGRSLAVVAHLGLATLALSYWLLTQGLQRLPATTVVTLGLAEPVTATLLGLLVLGERLQGQAALGVTLVFAGLLVLVCPLPHKEQKNEQGTA